MSDVGNETKAATKAAQGAGPAGSSRMANPSIGDTKLSGAVAELHAQHPYDCNDRSPHHDANQHMRQARK